jgi:hypothetical protein
MHPQFSIGRNRVEHKNADVERPLFNSVIGWLGLVWGYADRACGVESERFHLHAPLHERRRSAPRGGVRLMDLFGDFFTNGDQNRVRDVNVAANTMGPYTEVIVPNIRRDELPELFVVTRIGERRGQSSAFVSGMTIDLFVYAAR